VNTASASTDELAIAYHEIGHGVAGVRGGLHVTSCALRTTPTGTHLVGVTDAEPPAPGSPTDLWDAFVVFLFAGIAAETRHARQNGVWDRRVGEYIEHSASGDLEWWRSVRRHCSLTERQARRAADRLVRDDWSRIGRAARRLVRARHLPGSVL
jgi:hypothetical protein